MISSNLPFTAAGRKWVIDRGMLSQANLEYLRQTNRKIIIGAPRSELKKFEREILCKDWQEIHQGMQVQNCVLSEGEDEIFILRRSAERFEKDRAILERFIANIESGFEKINLSCQAGQLKKIGIAGPPDSPTYSGTG